MVVVVQGHAYNKHLPGYVANYQPPTLGQCSLKELSTVQLGTVKITGFLQLFSEIRCNFHWYLAIPAIVFITWASNLV